MKSQVQTVNLAIIVNCVGSSITDADLCGNKYPYSLARRQAPGRYLGIEVDNYRG
jgi:hypothetical protein